MAGHEWEDWFEREELIGQISDMRVQNLQVERELVQKRTFTRWMNLHLEKCDPPVEVHDLFRDIQDGHILMALLEELSGCKLLQGFKKSSHRIFRLNNIAKVLSFLEERNVKLVSIDAADVADGNASIILGLIWNIILFFQIKELTGNIRSQFPSSSSLSSIPTSSDLDTSFCGTPSEERRAASSAMREHSRAIKKLLQWVQKRTRKFGVAVQDFGKSWISGLAFLAVIKSIDSTLVDMRRALLRPARENLEEAFRTAHYSLGIPRLLDPEDVTVDRPDEQSIMIYVSQFLEHFPGIEEPEEPRHIIEKSISMCRLNSLDSDSKHIRINDVPGSRVKERSSRFQRDCARLPPKILISSVSEDRGIGSRPLRPAAARSWSSEDLLADSSCVEAISPGTLVEEPKKVANNVLIDSYSYFPQLSSIHSPSGSSEPESLNTDSVIGDSAISSPDSWVDSVFSVLPEKFGESRSSSSLCDSGTAWDVYRATPVEVTAIDEGFVPYMEDGAPYGQSGPESYIDEGIYSLSSIESTQGRVQGQGEVLRVERDYHNQSEAVLMSEQGVGEPREPFGLCDPEPLADAGAEEVFEIFSYTEVPPADHFEELLKQASVEENIEEEPERLNRAEVFISDAQDIEGHTNGVPESRTEGNNSEVEVEMTHQEADSPREESRTVEEVDGGLVETQSKANEGVLKDEPCPHKSFGSEICMALTGSHSTIQDECGSKTISINIPGISFSSEPGEQAEEGGSDPERQHHAWDLDRQLGSDLDVMSPQNPDEFNIESSDNEGKSQGESPSCLTSESREPATSEQIRGRENGHFDDGDEEDVVSRSQSSDIMDKVSDAKQELESLQPVSLSGSMEKNFKVLVSTEDAEGEPEQEVHFTDQLDGHKQTFSDTETDTTQQITLDRVQSKPNGTGGTACWEEGSGTRDLDRLYSDFDRHSPADVLVGDHLEPMDLFYPDKDEPMFTEPPDTEMQSWPSVLSVSALQPAPTSDTAPDDPPFILLGEEFTHGVDLMQENERVTTRTNPEADDASEAQKHSLMSGERNGGLWDGDGVDDDDDVPAEAEHLSFGFSGERTESVRNDNRSSCRQDENQIPPVLRHRKRLGCPESTGKQTSLTTMADNNNSDFWWGESGEMYLILLLWLLLYCYWLLPQMDLKTLPGLLLNLHH